MTHHWDEESPRVVVAIDFGTYGSGYAWMVIRPEITDPTLFRINHCASWPGNADRSSPKTRTVIVARSDGTLEFGSEALRRLAREKPGQSSGAVLIEDFKIALKSGRGGYRLDSDDLGVASLREAGLSVETAVSAFLTWMVGRVLDDLRESGVEAADISWCLTVPAIWELEERDQMRRAARSAGIPDERLILALEPESAAIYAHFWQQEAGGAASFDLYDRGSRFTVVDGGGGTIDITSYEVTGDSGLKQIGPATGERFGSQYLNQAFLDLVGKRIGKKTVAALRKSSPEGLRALLAAWETEKREVEFAPHDDVSIPLGGRLVSQLDPPAKARLAGAQGGIDDAIELTAAELDELFAAVVTPTLDYIDRQLRVVRGAGSPPGEQETIVLAGGFAASPYLQEAVRRRFDGIAKVIKVPLPEMAVLTGAVHFARNPNVLRARTIDVTWGVEVMEDFDPARHDERYRTTRDDKAAADHVFQIVARAGDTVPADKPVTQVFHPYTDSLGPIPIKLFSAHRRDPRYTDEDSAVQRAELFVPIEDMKDFPRTQRLVEVAIWFGRTELEVVATNTKSGDQQRIPVVYTARSR